jgi:hypothetical protein
MHSLLGTDHRVIGGSVDPESTWSPGTVQVAASFCVINHLIFCGVPS